MNNCTFIGNLTRDPEIKYVGETKTPLCMFTLAVNDERKNKDGERTAHFFDFDAWGKQAEIMSQFLTKGRQISVVAQAVQHTWEDKEGGKRSKVKFKVVNFWFINDGKGSPRPSTEEATSPDTDDSSF